MKGNILVVDDQPDNLILLTDILNAQGYEVRTAASGSSALRAIASHPPELILLDVNMPVMDGLEVCRRLKAGAATAAIPILFLGAQYEVTDKLRAFEAGGQDFIARPFVAADLLARVRCHLRLYQKQHDLEAEVGRALAKCAGAYDALHALSQRLVEAQECERRHLAHELHDEMGQRLTFIKLLLGQLDWGNPAEAQTLVTQAQEATEQLMRQVRDLSLELHPPILGDQGLLAALLWYFDRYTATTGIQIDFNYHRVVSRRFPQEVEVAAYRIAQEALTNIARHAHAAMASVSLWVEAGKLHLQIQDGGAGFDVSTVLAAHQTSGLTGMLERAQMCGGQVRFESAVGAGARVSLELPLRDFVGLAPTNLEAFKPSSPWAGLP